LATTMDGRDVLSRKRRSGLRATQDDLDNLLQENLHLRLQLMQQKQFQEQYYAQQRAMRATMARRGGKGVAPGPANMPLMLPPQVTGMPMSGQSAQAASRARGKRINSQYRGVYWNHTYNSWRARIWVNGKSEHLGNFDDEEEAARAFDARSRELNRDSSLNFPHESDALEHQANTLENGQQSANVPSNEQQEEEEDEGDSDDAAALEAVTHAHDPLTQVSQVAEEHSNSAHHLQDDQQLLDDSGPGLRSDHGGHEVESEPEHDGLGGTHKRPRLGSDDDLRNSLE